MNYLKQLDFNFINMTKKKISIGDLFELDTKKGKAFIQLVEKGDGVNTVEGVRVFYKLYTQLPEDLKEITNQDYFFLRFILNEAYKGGTATKVGNIPIPDDLKFPIFFRTEHIFKDGWWQVVNSITLERESVEKLNPEQKKLSPWGTWNDTLLIENLNNGWRLETWV